MKTFKVVVTVVFSCCLNLAHAQQESKTLKNSIGMEFTLIQPGTMLVGKYDPMYITPEGIKQGDKMIGQPFSPVINPGSRVMALMMSQGDRDNDKKLTRQEISALAAEWFAKLDTDNLEKISQQDFTQRFSSLTLPPEVVGETGSPASVPGGGRADAAAATGLFSATDMDKDGQLTQMEWKTTFEKWFDSWDTQNTGTVTEDEILVGLNTLFPSNTGRTTTFSAEEYKYAEEHAKSDATPGFMVKIEKPYYIGTFEVTQGQWKKVMGTNPSVFQGDKVSDEADQHPVDNVTWEQVQEFIKKLNALEKTKTYRLPTEFEWEYAARAGRQTDISPADATKEAWFDEFLRTSSTHRVGTKAPNPWGIYDMLGNVWEWVEDYDNLKFYADPVPPKRGKNHVLKGAGFTNHVKSMTYYNHGGGPGNKFDVGFRIIKVTQ